MVDCLRDEGGDILILLGPFVDWPVILYESQFPIFLFDEEEVSRIGTPQFSNGAPLEVFSHEFMHFLMFLLGEWEELPWESH